MRSSGITGTGTRYSIAAACLVLPGARSWISLSQTLASGHSSARQFQYWQEQSDKATAADDRTFRRILGMPPAEFIALLKTKRILVVV